MLTPPSAWPTRRAASGRPRPAIRLGGAHWEALEDERKQKRAYISRLKTIFHMEPLDLNLGDQLRESIASSVEECLGTTTLEETVDSIDSNLLIHDSDNRVQSVPLDTAALIAAAQRNHHTLMHAPDDASCVTELKPCSPKQHVVKLTLQRPHSAHLPTPARHCAPTLDTRSATGPHMTDGATRSTASAPVAHLTAPPPFVKRQPLLRPTPSVARSMRPRSAALRPTYAAQSNIARPVSAKKIAQQREQHQQQLHAPQQETKEREQQERQQTHEQLQWQQQQAQGEEEKRQEQKRQKQRQQQEPQRLQELQHQQQPQRRQKIQQERGQTSLQVRQTQNQQHQYQQHLELQWPTEQTKPTLHQKPPCYAKSTAGYSTRSTRAPSSAGHSSHRTATSIYSRQSTAALKQRCPSMSGPCTDTKSVAACGSAAAVRHPTARPVLAGAGTAARSHMRHVGRKPAELQSRRDDWRCVKKGEARTLCEQCCRASKGTRDHGISKRKEACGGTVEAQKQARANKIVFGDTFRALSKEEDALQRSLLRLDFLEMQLAKGDGEKEMSLAQFAHQSSLGQAYVVPSKATTESALLRSLQRLDRLRSRPHFFRMILVTLYSVTTYPACAEVIRKKNIPEQRRDL